MAQAVDLANRPNLREFMDATGVDFNIASEILYGTVGANTDQRDWSEIMSSTDPLEAARKASGEMYSGESLATRDTDTSGNLVLKPTETGLGGVVEWSMGGKPMYAITAADGTALRGGYYTKEAAMKAAYNFGLDRFLGSSSGSIRPEKTAQTSFTPAQTQPTPSSTPVQDQTSMQVKPVPETVNLQVTPPTYSGGITSVTEGDERAGTFSKPLQTAGLSAVPQNVQVKTHYAGTPGLVDPNLLLTTGSSGSGLVDPTLTLGTPLAQGNVGAAKGGLMSSTVPRETTLAGQPHRLAYVNPKEEEMMKKMGGSGIPGPGGVPSYISWSDVKDFFSGSSSTPEPASGSSTFSSDKNEVKKTTAAANESSNKDYITATTYSDGEWGYSTIEKPDIDDGNNNDTSNAVVVNEEVVPPPPPLITEPEPPVITEPEPPVVNSPVVSSPVTYNPPTPVSSDGVTSVPETVTQKVTAPSYGGDSTTSFKALASDDERSGTFSKPLQTAGLSAVPEEVTYKTHYAGTPNLVDPTLLTSTGSSTGGTQQMIYENRQTGQEIIVTVLGGSPVTYVPPGFTPKGVRKPSEGSENMAEGGYMRGYVEGGSVDKMLESKFIIARRYGYSGPKTNESLNAYAKSSPLISGKFRQIGVMMNQGGLAMAQGGTVPNRATIGGQPHRLAYVNPQEEALMKAAGGAGIPSYGGIPAYTTFGPGSTVGETATDPMTGTVYTWDGSSWKKAPAVAKNTNTDSQVQSTTGTTPEQFRAMQQNLISQTMQPTQAPVNYIQPTANQYIPVDAGQAVPVAPYAEAATVGTVQQAELPTSTAASTFDSFNVFPGVSAETSAMQPAQGTVSDQAQVSGQQQATSAVTGMQAAQGQATMVNAPAAREIQAGEIISGVADAEKASQFNEQIQAAEATPTKQATVAGQLENLMQQFEGGETPAWAAGSMRAAMATLSARGLGASSMAGQAVIQATMESALPIAQMDAQTQAQFEAQNLSNRQQRAMLAAQQRAQFLGMEFDQAFQARVANSARIGDIANMNFTAEQNVALENSRAANTMNLNNLSNSQAMVMAEAAALSNLDMANLNNRQQAAVQNAQNFMQMDMANLSNEQQTAMFKTQQNVQALFTDQASENASRQFNASSENQTNQFFSNLANQTAQFNASQQNAMDQFNVNSVNALREFNSNIQQQRDMFNAQNGLVIAQSNAQWRQNLDTLNTAALNESNKDFAATMNGLTAGNLEQIWQRERDIMSFAFSSSESAQDRALSILMAEMEVSALDKKLSAAESSGKTKFLLDVFEDPLKSLASDLVGGFI
jgi:hypothetical protein